jgi:four helix bundle protein
MTDEQANTGKVLHYKDLLIWQRSMELAKTIYRLTRGFPGEERYRLASQMRRAAISVPSNIAEGQARRGTREFVQFLSHASGSLAELDTQTLLSVEMEYIENKDADAVTSEIHEIQRMVAAIQRKLAVRLEQGTGYGATSRNSG